MIVIVRTVSIILILAGLAQYYLRINLTSVSAIPLVFSIVLFFLAGYALSRKAGHEDVWGVYIPMIIFGFWYFLYGGDYEPSFLVFFLPITFGILSLITIFTKGKSLRPELLGFLPVLFLFLDIGLLPFLVDTLNWPITPLVEGLILWMPWWTFFGLVTLPRGASGNRSLDFFLGSLKIIGFVYILALLVIPAIPNIGYDASKLPQAAQLEAAQVNLRAKLLRGDNPAWTNLKCIFIDPTDVTVCVQDETNKARYTRECEALGRTDMDACIQEQAAKEKEAGSLQGTASSIVKLATNVKFKEAAKEDFPTRSYQPRDIYPITLEIEDPRSETLNIGMKCDFKKGSEDVPGEISIEGQKENIFTSKETEKKTIECMPTQDLQGSYDLEYTATFTGVNTPSYLKRAFIPEVQDYQAKKDLQDQIESAEFPQSKDALSQSPEDFARMNFKFGSGTGSNPVISVGEAVRFSWGIENLAHGKILRINSYSFDDMINEGFNLDSSREIGDADCLQGGQVLVPETKITVLKSCWLDLPGDMKSIEEYRVQTFAATFNYDYELTHTVNNIRVEKLPETQTQTQTQTDGASVS